MIEDILCDIVRKLFENNTAEELTRLKPLMLSVMITAQRHGVDVSELEYFLEYL